MKSLISEKPISSINKICLTAIFIVMTIFCQKIFAINYIPIVPFLRISIGGPALIVLSSIYLGPFYGLCVGLFSDMLGYFLLDPKSFAYFPQITLIYALLGFVSYFVFYLVKKIKSIKVMKITFVSVLSIFLVAVSIYLLTNKTLYLYNSTYHLELWQSIIIIGTLAILLAFLIIFTFVYFSKNKEKEDSGINIIQSSFALLIIEITIMVLFGSLMKGWAFGFQTLDMILLCQIIILFINVPINVVLINILGRIIKHH